ncbi:MAG: acyl carrier protein [Planctomycetes bacterium]|nr:acyl carrier protein [Planctomycetota bacterium]
MLTLAGYCVLFAAIGFLFYVCARSMVRMSRRSSAVKRRAEQVMAGRPAINRSDFGSHFSPHHEAEIASRVHEMLEKILIVDVSRIRPDDKLIEDLGLGQIDGLDPNFLELDVKDAFGVDLRPVWRTGVTLRDLVHYIYAARSDQAV